jgi:hypothetical protein
MPGASKILGSSAGVWVHVLAEVTLLSFRIKSLLVLQSTYMSCWKRQWCLISRTWSVSISKNYMNGQFAKEKECTWIYSLQDKLLMSIHIGVAPTEKMEHFCAGQQVLWQL